MFFLHARSKLSSVGETNNGTGGHWHCLLPANPASSIRFKELLVRSARSNPVRKNRGGKGSEVSPALAQVVPGNHPGMQRMQKAYFAGDRGSVRMRSLVLQHFSWEIQAQIKTEAGRKMALKCEFCGKAPHYGNVISHANNTRRRRWNPNLKRVRAVVAGVRKQVRVCTACIRAGKVKKAA